MSVQLLEKLQQMNVNVQLQNGKLDIKAPKGVLTPDLVQEIKQGMSELVQALSAAPVKKTVQAEITPAPEADSYPLSSAQERLWLVSQFEEVNVVYNIPSTHYFTGQLDVDAFSRALDTMVQRHEVLRTVYRLNDAGEVRQYILTAAASGVKLRVVDASGHPDWEQWVADTMYTDFTTPINLATGPVFRGTMYKGPDDNWIFTFVQHHIVSDAITVAVLLNELFVLFMHYSEGKPSPLKPLPIQYRDYAVWQRKQLSGDTLKEHRDYWLQQFSGELPLFNLPGDRPRPAVKTYDGDIVQVSFGEAEITAAREICRKEGATLFMYLLAMVHVLLYRYTGQNDIIMGTPVAGRNYDELQGLMGIFINNLLLRCRTQDDDTFITLLRSARNQMLDAYTHQVYPFDSLVDDLHQQRDLSRSPLFDVMLVLQNAGMKHTKDDGNSKLGHLKLKAFGKQKAIRQSKYDLTITFFEVGKELKLDLEYNTGIYSRETITRLTGHLQQLMKLVPHNTGIAVNKLDYLLPEEKQLLITGFNNTAAAYPSAATIGQLFTQQAAQTPDKTALKFENTSLTYRQLDEVSNQLALYFQTRYGVTAGDTVGVLLSRSEKLIIALMAVLKAGAAYVPLDAEYPLARKEMMVKDTAIKLLVTQNDYISETSQYGGQVFSMDVQTEYEKLPAAPVTAAINSRNLAYIMYTSGSTGTPKGVMVEHRSVVRLVKQANFVQLNDTDTVLSLSAFAFDGSVFDIFGALLNGGTLVMPKKEVVIDTLKLCKVIEDEKVTAFFITSSLFNLLADTPSAPFTTLRYLLLGGERASAHHVRRFRLRHPGVQLFNVYGPTENTVFSTFYPVLEMNEQAITVPIGKPVSNSTVYILDEALQTVPVGVVGEICAGGDGLARGYLNQPELTRAKFIPHPFIAGENLYRTGDLGRWLPDGNIEFMGRKDDQVKIRGYRIEPGEIEAVLASYPGIDAVAVIVHENKNAEKQLLACISSAQPVSPQELTAYLSRQLPAYMMPSHLVQMEQLPLNANGKIDKRKLTLPEQPGHAATTEYTAPRNSIEEKLVLIWQEILVHDRIGVKDNFFELGGHSLKATKLALSIKKEFNTEISLKAMFTGPTIEQMAGEISREIWLRDNGQTAGDAEAELESVEI